LRPPSSDSDFELLSFFEITHTGGRASQSCALASSAIVLGKRDDGPAIRHRLARAVGKNHNHQAQLFLLRPEESGPLSIRISSAEISTRGSSSRGQIGVSSRVTERNLHDGAFWHVLGAKTAFRGFCRNVTPVRVPHFDCSFNSFSVPAALVCRPFLLESDY
jgi:hypothetical protein